MARIIFARVSGLCFMGALMFGGLAAVEQPSSAQITEKCWKEYCVYDPDIKGDRCVKHEITCPPPT